MALVETHFFFVFLNCLSIVSSNLKSKNLCRCSREKYFQKFCSSYRKFEWLSHNFTRGCAPPLAFLHIRCTWKVTWKHNRYPNCEPKHHCRSLQLSRVLMMALRTSKRLTRKKCALENVTKNFFFHVSFWLSLVFLYCELQKLLGPACQTLNNSASACRLFCCCLLSSAIPCILLHSSLLQMFYIAMIYKTRSIFF